MQRFMLIVAGLGLCSSLHAFEGRVIPPDGSAIRDATVSILGYPGSSRTDQNGRFIWSPDPPLPFEVLIVMPGGNFHTGFLRAGRAMLLTPWTGAKPCD